MNIVNNEFDSKEWEQTKLSWKKKVESVMIPSDIQGRVPYFESKLDRLYTEVKWIYEDYNSKLKSVEDKIEVVKKANMNKGSNKAEREANAYRYIMYFPTGEEDDENATNLFAIRDALNKRVHFFKEYVIDVLKSKSNRLSNDVGSMKVDAQFTSNIDKVI